MKTSKLLIFGITAGFLILGVAACSEQMYRMDTQINDNGSGIRTIYVDGDSAFLAGDTLHNPFFFSYSSDWRLKTVDTLKAMFDKKIIYNVGISKPFRSVTEGSGGLLLPEGLRLFIAPKERLKKHFRWFYTYYSFEVVYPCLSAPVSIDNYMSKDEQKCWFQGDFSIYRGNSGYECKDEMDDLEAKFYEWWLRNKYEVSFNTIRHFAEQISDNPPFSGLENVKDTVFSLNKSDLKKVFDLNNDVQPEDVCKMLDTYFQTTVFSSFFSKNKDDINNYFNKCMQKWDAPNKVLLEYHLTFPGKVFQTNAGWNRGDTLIWKIDPIRLYASENYRLTAESRKTNIWAFIVTFLVGLSTFVFFRKK